jgi:hypothetical protein
MATTPCCSCDTSYPNNQSRCMRCIGCGDKDCNITAYNTTVQKRIWKQVRVPSSLFMMAKSSAAVRGSSQNDPVLEYSYVNWNQSSDRSIPSVQKTIVKTHGNSTRQTLTSHRPGAGSPGGIGVDVKHGSYARYLARKKSGIVKSQQPTEYNPIRGNKTQSFGLLSSNCVRCRL